MKGSVIFILGIVVLFSFSFVKADAYDDYNTYAINEFGAEKDDLIYDKFGNDLVIHESDLWTYESENSAVFGFDTNLPSKSYIEYGLDTNYGMRTDVDDRYYYLHVEHVKNLAENRTYHYRIVAEDERGNIVYGTANTFNTQIFENKIEVYNNFSTDINVLDQADTIYVVKEDITADTRAFTLAANNITLDLNGHTVTYDMGTPAVPSNAAWTEYEYRPDSTAGVFGTTYNYFHKLTNGFIKQGANNGQGTDGYGFNPVYIYGTNEISGIVTKYSGADVHGINARYGTPYIHHNIVIDRGNVISNRHQGLRAIFSSISGSTNVVKNNLVKRSRHQGIYKFGNGINNEVYIDSFDTNSFGMSPNAGGRLTNNKVFGAGYIVMGISWEGNITVNDNLVYLQGVNRSNRSSEYGEACSMTGIRLTQYLGGTILYENNLYEDNLIIIKGREGCSPLRGVEFFSDPYVVNLTFRNNIVKVEAQDDFTGATISTIEGMGCIIGQGLADRSYEQLPVYYQNNLLISNIGLVQFGDSYGTGGNHRFINNTLIKFGNHPGYKTVKAGYYYINSFGNRFIDTKLEGGASLDDYFFDSTGLVDYSIGHSLYVIAKDGIGNLLVNKDIEVYDSEGFSYVGKTDANGFTKLEILNRTLRSDVGTTAVYNIDRIGHYAHIDGYDSNVILPMNIMQNYDNPIVLIFGEGTGTSYDVNSDGNINIIDLAIVIYNQGRSAIGDYARLDLNGDGEVNWLDVVEVISRI